MQLRALHESADEAAALMRALGNADRLLLMCELSQGELCVSDLAERTGIEQPTLSQQLAVLRTQGLVETRRDGKRIHYSVGDPRAMALLKTLYRLFCGKD
jgi:ArsR family transcriptional regulator